MKTEAVPDSIRHAIEEFRGRLGGEPRIFRAPGRVNLIGGHLDYNEGWVLPIAIDRSCFVLARRRADRKLRVHSAHFGETLEFALDDPRPSAFHWTWYVRGVAWSLAREQSEVPGADLFIESEVPIGAGLSSSAAIEVAAALALLGLAGATVDPAALARACQRAENEYVGMRCGIMDQLAACCGRRGCALLIDCRPLALEPVAIDETRVRIVVANTMVKHALAASEYNQRRRECEEAAARIRQTHPAVRTLRDITWEEAEALSRTWPEALRRRARHVTTEMARVPAAVQAIRASDFETLGRLISESHDSLDADFQVSSPELNSMISIASSLPGFLGGRMTGGGFGGSTVNLVRAEHVEAFASALAQGYENASGRRPDVYPCRASEAGGEVEYNRGSESEAGAAAGKRIE